MNRDQPQTLGSNSLLTPYNIVGTECLFLSHVRVRSSHLLPRTCLSLLRWERTSVPFFYTQLLPWVEGQASHWPCLQKHSLHTVPISGSTDLWEVGIFRYWLHAMTTTGRGFFTTGHCHLEMALGRKETGGASGPDCFRKDGGARFYVRPHKTNPRGNRRHGVAKMELSV